MGYNNNSNNCNCNSCNCNNNNCDNLIKKYHYLVNKSDDLYAQADNKQADAINAVNYAINSLNEFVCLFNNNYATFNKATEMLENSNCDSMCNAGSCKCQKLNDACDKYYYQQLDSICEALESLQHALCNLNNAVDYGLEGDKLYAAFKACAHK